YWRHTPHSDLIIENLEFIDKILNPPHLINCPQLFFLNNQEVLALVINDNLNYLIGPIFIEEHGEKFHQTLLKTSVIQMDFLCEELCLLQNVISGGQLSTNDVFVQNQLYEKEIQQNEASLTESLFANQEYEFIHNPYDQEVRELSSVQNGDLEKLNDSLQEVFEGHFPVLGPNKVRSMKNLAIVDLALLARAAIKGGLDYEKSFSINDQYIRSVESLTNSSEITALTLQAKRTYTELVHELIHNDFKTSSNVIIKRCKVYIQTHLHTKITLNKLAKHCCVSTQYLSRTFHKTQAQTLIQYMQHEKIEATKRELIYTNDKISAIAVDYGYSSASHYTMVFKQLNHITPTAYRSTHGKI
ncbi:MAG: AraC family transcriptional regulator, partial [Lentilactobacillus hilgardii]